MITENQETPRIIHRLIGALFLCLVCFSGLGICQTPPTASANYRFDHWRREDGLPDNSVRAILQTSDGYLWLGTPRGLARFDGVRFTFFNTRNTPALRNDAITSLLEDREKTLWIGTGGGGITRLRSGHFSTVTTADGLSSNFVPVICQDSTGAVWIGTAGSGLNRFEGGTITHFTTKTGLANNSIKCLFVDRSGVLWIGSNGGGLTRFVNGSMEHFSIKQGLPSDDVTALCEDRQGILWIGTSRGIARMRNGRIEEHARSKALSHPFVSSLIADDEGILWIGSKGGGLSRLSGMDLQTYTVIDGLNRDFVSTLSQDREGNVWIGIERGGLNMLRKTKISTFTTRDGLRSDYVRSVYQDRGGTVWAGINDGGLSFLRNGKFTMISLKEVFSNDLVRALFEDRSGNLWIGTWGGGIGLLGNGKVTKPAFLREFPGRYIRAIVEDRNGGTWVAANGQGAYRYASGRWTLFDTRSGLSNIFVSSIVEDSSGTVWIGTSGGGLNRLSHDSITSLRIGDGLTSDFVTALHIDADETLWIGTNGGGLCRLHRGQITSWTAAAGLVDESIEAIVDDQEGNLWLSGPRGISRVSKHELNEHARGALARLHVLTFDETDGMRSSECTGGSKNAGARTKDGRIWFPTVDGLVVIDPRTISKGSQRFPVYVESIAIDKVPTSISSPIIADFGNGEIEVQYTAVSFRNAKKVQFRYRLEGFEEVWQDARSRRTAFYTNVPPGKYVFHVEADAGAGANTPQRASIAFTILPPFWMTGWFRAILALGAVGVVAGSVRYFSTQKLKRKLEKVEAQAALERERVRISKDMHDELGASLTKISLLSEIAKRSIGNPDEIKAQLERVSMATRETANTMDEIVWAVSPHNDTIEHFVAYILQYAQDFLSATTIHYRTEAPEVLPEGMVSAEMRHNTFLVVKEALNNIVKHSEASEVWMRIRHNHRTIDLSIEDNGKGFTPEAIDQFSNGLKNMRRRIEDAGGTFTLVSTPQVGTSLRISVSI